VERFHVMQLLGNSRN